MEKKKYDLNIQGNWYSYDNNYYSEFYIDSIDIYSNYEDIYFPPPVKYQYKNDTIFKFYDQEYKKPYELNGRVEIKNENKILILFNFNKDTVIIYRLPSNEFSLEMVKTYKNEKFYLTRFRKRQKDIVEIYNTKNWNISYFIEKIK